MSENNENEAQQDHVKTNAKANSDEQNNQQHKNTINSKGSKPKPFNVVMTPSDKKNA